MPDEVKPVTETKPRGERNVSREARLKELAQAARRKLKRSKEEAEDLRKENEALKAKPDAKQLQEKLAKLEAEKAGDAHKAAFGRAAIKLGANPNLVDELYKLAEVDQDGDEPDPKAMTKAAREALKFRPHYLAKPADEDGDEPDDGESEGEEGDDGELRETEAGSKGKETSVKGKLDAGGKAQLSRGEGATRGGRDDHKKTTIEDVVNADFAATGRTNAFSL